MTALTPGEVLVGRDRSRATRRGHSAKTSRLLTLVLVLLALGGIAISVRGGSYLLDEFLRRRAAVYSGAAAPVAAEAQGKPRPIERATASLPPFDEFAVRAIVKQVPAPPGTGLPNLEWLTLDPNGIFPVMVHLVVEGVDNAAWQGLSEGEQRHYADQILAALVAKYPEVETTKRWSPVYYMVKIYERFRVSSSEVADLEEEIRCLRAGSGAGTSECRGISVGVLVAVPARKVG